MSGLPPVASTIIDGIDLFQYQVDKRVLETRLGGSDDGLSIPIWFSQTSSSVDQQYAARLYSFNSVVNCAGNNQSASIAVSDSSKTWLYGGATDNVNIANATACSVGASQFEDGSSLTAGTPYSGSQGYTFVDRDGGVSYFYYDSPYVVGHLKGQLYWPIRKHIFPNGVTWTYTILPGTPGFGNQYAPTTGSVGPNKAFQSVTSSSGYQVSLSQPSGTAPTLTFSTTTCLNACSASTIGSLVSAYVYSSQSPSPIGEDLTLNGIYYGRMVYPLSVAGGPVNVAFEGTTMASSTSIFRYQFACDSSQSFDYSFESCAGGLANKVIDGNGNFAVVTSGTSSYNETRIVTDRAEQKWTYAGSGINNALTPVYLGMIVDPLGRSTTYAWNFTVGDVASVTYPSGKVVSAQYDSRGNETRTTVSAATQGQAPLVTTRNFPTSCTGSFTQKDCNKPLSIIDPNGKETDYTWSPIYGGLLSEIKPPDASGNRQSITFGYTAFTGIDGVTFYLLTSKTEQIDPTHSVVTQWQYDPTNHWELIGRVDDAGGLALLTCFRRDAMGNEVGKTMPRAALTTCPQGAD
jgi:hypothetical protein